MAEEKHHHLFHHKKDEDKGDVNSENTTAYGGAYSSEENEGQYNKKEEIDYKKEEKHHKHIEHATELGIAAAGAFALVYLLYIFNYMGFSTLFFLKHLVIFISKGFYPRLFEI